MICPFSQGRDAVQPNCYQESCALWCNEDGCAIKKIALELTKLTEKKE
jgi:hypothetical protein